MMNKKEVTPVCFFLLLFNSKCVKDLCVLLNVMERNYGDDNCMNQVFNNSNLLTF